MTWSSWSRGVIGKHPLDCLIAGVWVESFQKMVMCCKTWSINFIEWKVPSPGARTCDPDTKCLAQLYKCSYRLSHIAFLLYLHNIGRIGMHHKRERCSEEWQVIGDSVEPDKTWAGLGSSIYIRGSVSVEQPSANPWPLLYDRPQNSCYM